MLTEEIGTYMRCWESPGDLPLLIEKDVSFRSFRCAPLAKRHKIYITRGRSPGLSPFNSEVRSCDAFVLVLR
jgi:hypothetical protein